MKERDQGLTIKQVQEMLGCSKQTVYNLLNEGKLKGFKVRAARRILRSEVERYIKEHSNGVTKEGSEEQKR